MFNVGTGEGTSVRAMIDEILTVAGSHLHTGGAPPATGRPGQRGGVAGADRREARLAGRTRPRGDRAFSVGCPPDRNAGRVSATDVAPARGPVSHSARLFWIPFAFIAVLASLWALASPLFSIPDENAHATKAIAQVRGELVGAAEAGKKYLVVDLPPGYHYNHSAMCYLFVPTQSAHCAASFGDGTGNDYFENWVGAYNPIYYYLVGWPSLLTDNGAVGVYAMRIVSALLGAAFLAWAFQAALSSIRSRWLPLGLLLVAGPMVLYLVGSVNPNGVEIAAAAALWASLLRLLERHDDRLEAAWSSLPAWYLWLIVTVSSILLANARSVGPLWLVVVVAACVAITGRRAARAFFTRARNYIWIAVIAAGTLFAGVWTLATGGVGAQAGTADAPLVGKGFFSGFAAMIRFTPNFLQQQLGVFGWLDTPLPWILYAVISIAIGVVVVLAITGTDRRSAIVVLSALAATILIPAVVQATHDQPYRPHLAGAVRTVPLPGHTAARSVDAVGTGRRTARVPVGARRLDRARARRRVQHRRLLRRAASLRHRLRRGNRRHVPPGLAATARLGGAGRRSTRSR